MTLEDHLLRRLENRKFAVAYLTQILDDLKAEDGKEMLADGLILLARAHGITLIEVK